MTDLQSVKPKGRKPKERTVPQLVEEAAIILQRIVRVKAAIAENNRGKITCVACGKQDYWQVMNGGHFAARDHINTKLMEENIHPLDVRCNKLNGHDGLVLVNYYEYLCEMYGKEFVDNDIRNAALIPKVYKRAEILEIKAQFEQRLAELEKRLLVMFNSLQK
jgi:hypothetical protein